MGIITKPSPPIRSPDHGRRKLPPPKPNRSKVAPLFRGPPKEKEQLSPSRQTVTLDIKSLDEVDGPSKPRSRREAQVFRRMRERGKNGEGFVCVLGVKDVGESHSVAIVFTALRKIESRFGSREEGRVEFFPNTVYIRFHNSADADQVAEHFMKNTFLGKHVDSKEVVDLSNLDLTGYELTSRSSERESRS